MFENTTDFDFEDDDMLNNSFTPVVSSTQSSQRVTEVVKQFSEAEDLEVPKKLKLSLSKHAVCKQSSFACSPEEKKNIPFSCSNKVVKRKFPGPAGLLPDRKNKSLLQHKSNENEKFIESDCSVNGSNNASISKTNVSERKRYIDHKSVSIMSISSGYEHSSRYQEDIILCSQQTSSTFEDGPWKEMTKDFYISDGVPPYEKFTIHWIKKQAHLKKLLFNHKAPFLAAIIQSLEILDGKVPIINVTLKDATGDIQGTILHSLYEEHSNSFTLGSVIVLKQIGVFSAVYNNLCLTITPNNLVIIYCLELPKSQPDGEFNENKDKVVKKVVIHSCTAEEILNKYNDDMKLQEKKINFGRLQQSTKMLQRSLSDQNCLSSNNILRNNSNSVLRKNSEGGNFYKINSKSSSIMMNMPIKALSNHNQLLPKYSSDAANENIKNQSSNNAYETSNVPIEFNFKHKEGSCLKVNSNNSNSKYNENDSSNIGNCDKIISSGQVTVKTVKEEDTEIWKKLLEDVDADSLFDDF